MHQTYAWWTKLASEYFSDLGNEIFPAVLAGYFLRIETKCQSLGQSLGPLFCFPPICMWATIHFRNIALQFFQNPGSVASQSEKIA